MTDYPKGPNINLFIVHAQPPLYIQHDLTNSKLNTNHNHNHQQKQYSHLYNYNPINQTSQTNDLLPPLSANILLAAGGYNSFDAHLLPANFRNRTFGYSYPEWYSGVADSPAKIAQQLMKFGGFKRQRLQEQQLQQQQEQLNFNQTTAFLAARLTEAGNKAKFTILDEPRFVGFGTVELDSNREARLSCSFGEAIDQNNVSSRLKSVVTSTHVISSY